MRRATLYFLSALAALLVLFLRLATGGGPGAAAAPDPREPDENGTRAPAALMLPAAELDGAAPIVTRAPAAETRAHRPAVWDDRAQLRLVLLDVVTGEAFAGTVELWHLDLPEDETFTEGDVRIADGAVPAEGRVFAKLPPGRYRATCAQVRAGAEDPPAFLIEPGEQTLALWIERPRNFVVRTRVVDETGAPIRSLRAGKSYRGGRAPEHPEWARPRTRRTPPEVDWLMAGGGARAGSFGSRNSRADEHGFHRSVELEEASRGVPRVLRLTFASSGRAQGTLRVPVNVAEVRAYVCPLPSLEPYRERVLLPNGALAVDAGAELRVEAEAVPFDPDYDHEAWLRAPIRVRVELEGYEPLEAEHRLGDGEPPWLVLAPSAQ